MIALALLSQRGALAAYRRSAERMTVKDELHELIDQLDEETAREALAYLQDLRLRGAPIGWRDLPQEA
jgi:hypothetical protein